MNNTFENVLRQVQKLLKLAEHANTNPEEAAVAAAKAQKLMDEYKIERLTAEAAPDQASEDETLFQTSTGSPLDDHGKGKKAPTWKAWLVGYNQVQMYSVDP